jgi:hypothetical protein
MVSRQLHKRIRLALTPLLARPHPNEKNYTDERNIPPLNRIGDPDDILASVRVENGKVGLYLSPPHGVSRLPTVPFADSCGDISGDALVSPLHRTWCYPAH